MRRAAFYLFYDPSGQVDDYVLHTLSHLRPHVEHIFVASNCPLDEANRARLESVADQVWERENVGLDVWAYKEALAFTGPAALAEYDEIVLLNYTFFGPVGSFDGLFAEMEARPELDFWGITEHGDTESHAFDSSIPMDGHIQSHWIAVRRRMFTSPEWVAYWDDMPMITSYEDSITRHEARFTALFVSHGFVHTTAFPVTDYDSAHPIMDNIAQMLRDGCPIVKRRSFFHDPLYNEAHANDGRQIMRLMAERGYPVDLMLANLARTSRPRNLVTNLGLLEVLPDVDLGYDHAAPLRVVAVAHIYYPEMTDEIVDRLDLLPGDYDLVVTTADEERRRAILETLERRGRAADVRVVASNKGRDISAFFVDCRDVLLSDDHDIVVKLHSKKSPQDGHNIGELFKRHLFENLLASPGHAANVLRLFQQYSSLGMVIPPIYHIGYPTLGHSWFGNKDQAEDEAEFMGIRVPFDVDSPLSAYGSMFIARPQTLRAIASAGYTHDDFPGDDDYRDGALTHVLERLMTYAVLSSGHHVREVMSADLAAVNYSFLEYRSIVVGAHTAPYPRDALRRIAKLKQFRRRTLKRGRFAPETQHLSDEQWAREKDLSDKERRAERRERPRDARGRYLPPAPDADDAVTVAAGQLPERHVPAGSGGSTWPHRP